MIIALLLGLVSGAYAVDAFDEHCATISLLQDPTVRTEIGLNQSQRDKMNEHARAYDKKLADYAKKLAGKQPDGTVLQQYLDQLKKGVLSQMTQPQIKRLRELSIQAAGLLGPLDPIVASKIGMSSAEAKKYKQTYVDGKTSAERLLQQTLGPIQQKYIKLALPYRGKEKEHEKELADLKKRFDVEAKAATTKIKPRVDSITKNTETKLIAMITPKQKAVWTAIQGKKFVPPKKK